LDFDQKVHIAIKSISQYLLEDKIRLDEFKIPTTQIIEEEKHTLLKS